MKQAIRALGWATTTLWILVILFSGTVVYSATQIKMNFQGEPRISTSNGTLTMSFPFSIDNNGLYDISDMNITTIIIAENKTVISGSSSFIETIQGGSSVNATHDVVLSINDTLTKNLTHLIFNDTTLNMNMFVKLTYAHTIPLKISANQTMPWGAPIYNLTVKKVSMVSPNEATVFLSFENHAFFGLDGAINLELLDEANEKIGSGSGDLFVPPGAPYDDAITVTLTEMPSDEVKVRLWFNTSLFSIGPLVMEIG